MAAKLDVLIKLKDEFTKGIKSVERDFKKSTNNIKKSFKDIATLPNIIAAAAPIVAIKGALQASMEMDALNAKMTAALPSMGAAANEMEYIREESERMGISFQRTASDYALFSASATRSGVSLKTTRDVFRDFSEVATSLKLRPEQISSVFLALEQMSSLGTVQAQELKIQLGQVIPGAFELAAKAAGKTGRQFMKMMKNGEVITSEFLPKFSKLVRSELGGGFEQASQTLQSNIERIKNDIFSLSSTVGGFISEDANGIASAIHKSAQSATSDSEDIKKAFMTVRFAVVVLWNNLQNIYETLKTVFQFGIIAGRMFAAPLVSAFNIVGDSAKALGQQISAALHGDFKRVAEINAGAWKNIGIELSNLLETEKNLAGDFNKNFFDNSKNIDKNLQDIADAYGKMETAFQGGTKKLGTKQVDMKVNVIKPEVDDEKERKQREKEWQKYLKMQQKWQDQILETEFILTESKNDLRKKSTNHEIAELDLKFSKLREKYKSNNIALINIDEAYLNSKKRILSDQVTVVSDAYEEIKNDSIEKLNKTINLDFIKNNGIMKTLSTIIDSWKDKSGQTELANLSTKHKRELELYYGNKEALLLIDKKYALEKKMIEQKISKTSKENMMQQYGTVVTSLEVMSGKVKEFVDIYKAAAVIQIIADAHKAASSVFAATMGGLAWMGPFALPVATAAAGTVYAAGALRAADLTGLSFGLGTRDFRTTGPTMIQVGDNPGGRERVSVTPESSQNVNGPSNGGGNIIINLKDHSGNLMETIRSKIKSGEGDRLVRELISRNGAIA